MDHLAGAVGPGLGRVHMMRTYSGRPSSSMQLSARTAMATSVARRRSVRQRSAPDYAVEARDVGLHQGTPVVARGLLPAHAPTPRHNPKMLVPLGRRHLGRGARYRAGTTTAASGCRASTSGRRRPGVGAVGGERGGPATWSSKGPACEASSTPCAVNSAATVRPVSASTSMRSCATTGASCSRASRPATCSGHITAALYCPPADARGGCRTGAEAAAPPTSRLGG